MRKDYGKQFTRTKANKIKHIQKMLKQNPNNPLAKKALEKREQQTYSKIRFGK
jgi:hypothetical protein